MAINDVYQVVANHIIAGKETANALYYRETVASSQGPTVSGRDLALTFFLELWDNTWQDVLSNEVTLSGIWGQRIWPTRDLAGYWPVINEAGNVVGESLPNGSAVLISGKGIITTRNFWRRIYVAGLPEIHQEKSEIIPSARALWITLAAAFRVQTFEPTGLTPGKWVPCAYSRDLSAEAGPQPTSDFGTLALNTAIKSQRRRNLKRSSVL